MRLLFSSGGKKKKISFARSATFSTSFLPESNFGQGLANRNERLKKKKKKKEREDETKRRKRFKKKKWPQWKSGVAEFQIKFGPFARDWYRKCSSQGKLVGVDSPDNFFPTPSPSLSPPSSLFWHLFVIAASRDRISTRRDTRLLLDGISNCNDSSPTVCSSYCFPISEPRRNCADTTERGGQAERNTLLSRRRRGRSIALLIVVIAIVACEYSVTRVW